MTPHGRMLKAVADLEADFAETVAWAESEGARWAFTLSNAGVRSGWFPKMAW